MPRFSGQDPALSSTTNMNSPASLTGTQQRTYQRIFQHPVSHILAWHEIYRMFRHLGQVEEEHNGGVKLTRNGQSLVLHPHRPKDTAEIGEIMAVRHFLEGTEATEPGAEGERPHLLLVIDHHEARIFRTEMHGEVPQQILPHKPDEFFRHAHHSRDFSRGQEKPDPNSFFEPVARALNAAGRILIFGTGTGTGSEMFQFVAWLKLRHPELAARIIGSLVVNESHLTTDQLLAKAREFYTTNAQASPV
jgi:hypothetical protein